MRNERFWVTVSILTVGAALWAACSDHSSESTAGAAGTSGTSITYYTGSDGSVYDWNDAAGPCQPARADAFKPVKIAPLVNPVCTDDQINGLVTQCYDPSLPDSSACDAWKAVPDNQSCLTSCPVSTPIAPGAISGNPPPTPAGPWGPLVKLENPGKIQFFDLGTCVALMDPSAAGQACADAINTELECEYYACAANCPIPTSATADPSTIIAAKEAYIYCTYAADSGPCASYVKPVADCVAALPPEAPELFCVDGTLMSGDPSSFNPAAAKLLGAQCGGAPPSDAGTH